MKTLRLIFLGIAIGLGAALLLPYLQEEWSDTPETLQPQPEISVPENGIVSDAFSLQLFRAALERSEEKGSVVVAPLCTTEWLNDLANNFCGDAARKQIEQLKPSSRDVNIHRCMELGAMLAADDSLHFAPNDAFVLRVPFARNFPFASELFFSLSGEMSHPPTRKTNLISPETRLMGAMATEIQAQWLRPFYTADTKKDDFNNADGRMPQVDMMRCRNAFRVAQANDGSWQAAALFLAAAKEDKGKAPLALIVILPQGDTRAFAQQLTPEQLSAIRESLVKAPYTDTKVTLPRMSIRPVADDISPLLQQVGVTAPFDIRQADFTPMFSDKIAMNGVVEYLSLLFEESPEQHPKDSSIEQEGGMDFTVNRPFIWILGDLTTDTPPYAMGMVENL